jgi:hypothetical protein
MLPNGRAVQLAHKICSGLVYGRLSHAMQCQFIRDEHSMRPKQGELLVSMALLVAYLGSGNV